MRIRGSTLDTVASVRNNLRHVRVYAQSKRRVSEAMPKALPNAVSAAKINSTLCEYCDCQIPFDRTQCPHCAQPQLFPNVRLAEQDDEKVKLIERYRNAHKDCQQRGCEDIFQDFDQACTASFAVFNCAPAKFFRAISTGTDLFETYHDLERLRIRHERPADHDWQRLRPQAEIELLGTHAHLDKLHYAALSLDGAGLASYGACAVTLKESMIAHRTSCFEGNSALIFEQQHNFSNCLRSSWNDRHTLCASKIAADLDNSVSVDDFPELLCRPGLTQDEDRFVEAHIFGTMTAQTFENVRVDQSRLNRTEKTLWKATREKLNKAGVTITET